MIINLIFVVFCSALLTWGLLKVMIPSLVRFVLDRPGVRSSHLQPVPSGGGLAFVIVSASASAFACLFLSSSFSHMSLPLVVAPLFALPLSLVGFLDDRYNLPSLWRYIAQLITAVLVITVSPLVDLSSINLSLLVLMVFSITAVINFSNFMDGLDGLVAGCMFIAIAAASVHISAPWTIWSLVGGLLGFLLWNWSPAKVFMGDVGSTFLGAVFSLIVLQSSNWSDALALLLMVTPLLGDACLCVLRRLMAGQLVFQAHRLHLFQRLHRAGWSHARVSSLYIVSTALLASALLLGGLSYLITVVLLELLVGFWLDQRVAVPFAVASRH